MGYYITQTNTISFPKKNLPKADAILKKLVDKKYNQIKRGGVVGTDDKWFSWLPNSDLEKGFMVVFEGLGFEIEEKKNDVVLSGFDRKFGQEVLLLSILYPLYNKPQFFEYIGEDLEEASFELNYDTLCGTISSHISFSEIFDRLSGKTSESRIASTKETTDKILDQIKSDFKELSIKTNQNTR